MSKSLEELNLGTYDNLHIVCFIDLIFLFLLFQSKIDEDTTVIEAMHYFVEYRVSALPVVDKNKKLVNIYSKFDVIVSKID
jgi:5'-AMP-activated protein kinase regulatory gamma subunit